MDAAGEARFAAALLDPMRPPPDGLRLRHGGDPASRFAIYRNNVAVSLLEALAERFPVTRTLVGDEFFRAMARLYLQDDLPSSRLLHEYGAMFPDFVERFAPARPLPYLAGVARLEAARTFAYHAADAEPLAAAAFGSVAPDAVGRLRLCLHPSVRLLASPWPVLSIWLAHVRGSDAQDQPNPELGRIDLTRSEAVLIARPRNEVRQWLLPAGGHEFLAAIAAGAPLADAAAQAEVTMPHFEPTASLTLLIQAEIVVGLTQPES
jgi:hypothetical protein